MQFSGRLGMAQMPGLDSNSVQTPPLSSARISPFAGCGPGPREVGQAFELFSLLRLLL
jgi:hypothetical protein